MGGSNSKGQVLSKTPPQPQYEPPYHGPSAEYCFINTNVTMSAQVSFGFMSNSMVTSNVDAYYPVLAQPYAQGFRLLSFYHIPGQVQRTGGLFSRDVMMPFQGIYCRYPSAPSNQGYQLKIEKSVIQPQIVWNGFITTRSDVVTDIQHLFQTIANNTQNGGRLICIELTGQEQVQASFSMNQRMPSN
ncbi:uncharacterized protein LOC101857856 [Aplysia californica]|uniref:Uncharacterized protein LOC101857856 n=1 Tax=Aplysia californica TaxID=6500 RepID=A0ABM0KB84_APLCA|nr:uncharacterized protein LOC101857856 [Aplysia californica]